MMVVRYLSDDLVITSYRLKVT